MSLEIVLVCTRDDGSVVPQRVSISQTELSLLYRNIASVSDNIAQLTRVSNVVLGYNALVEIPAGVLAMTQLKQLALGHNRLDAIPPEIGRLTGLTLLSLRSNRIDALPREIGELRALEYLSLDNNALTSLPSELGQLPSVRRLNLQRNCLEWLPVALDRLPATTEICLNGNPLPIDVGVAYDRSVDSRANLSELFAATTAIAMIRDGATTIAVGLQDLELPALVTLEILDAAWPNSIPMHKKWDLVVAVKHFHQRRAQ